MCRWKSLSFWRTERKRRTGYEGKIEEDGTREGVCPGLHVGCGGTPLTRRGAPGWVKGREEKGFGRASARRVRWSWRGGRR